EVVTARLRVGGYQSVLNVRPDLTTLGKIIGGGLPVGAMGGREDVMAVFDPRRPDAVYHAGTFNGNPLTMAAGCASLDLLPEAEVDRINALGDAFAERMTAVIAESGLGVAVTSCGSLTQFHTDHDLMARLHRAALDEG